MEALFYIFISEEGRSFVMEPETRRGWKCLWVLSPSCLLDSLKGFYNVKTEFQRWGTNICIFPNAPNGFWWGFRTTDPLIFISLGPCGLPQKFPLVCSTLFCCMILQKLLFEESIPLLKAKLLRTTEVVCWASRHRSLFTWVCQVDQLAIISWRLKYVTAVPG